MKFDELIPKITSYAPLLGSALGGPAGGLVGSLIANVFGADSSKISDLAKKIESDPDAEYKLKSLQFQIAQINLQQYQAAVDDAKDARKRQIALHDHIPSVIAIAFVIMYAVIQYFVINHPGQQDDIISARIQDIMVMIVGYYFGSAYKRRKQENG